MSPKWNRRAAALLLSAGLVLTIFGLSVSADQSVDLSRSCSLNLSTAAYEDLSSAQVVLDLYRVARAVPTQDSSDYTFAPLTGLEGLGLERVGQKDTDTAAVAAKTATALLDKSVMPTVSAAPADSPITELESGLYLVLARGESVTDSVLRDENGTVTATVAQSAAYEYRFAPELVALPYRADAQSPWIYDLTGSLKATQERRDEVLEIHKTLEDYRPNLGTATFVYDVEATLDRDGDGRAEKIYSDVLSLSFSAAGEKSLYVNLPVGASVTVTEVYTGFSYQLSGGGASPERHRRGGGFLPGELHQPLERRRGGRHQRQQPLCVQRCRRPLGLDASGGQHSGVRRAET